MARGMCRERRGGIGIAVAATMNNALRDANDSATAVPAADNVSVTLRGLIGYS